MGFKSIKIIRNINILVLFFMGMEVLLDGSFIISCIRNRIDFLEQLVDQGFNPVVPKEVIQEMKDLIVKNKTSHEDRLAIRVALELIEKRKVRKTSLGRGKVDDSLVLKGKEGVFIATLDSAIKKKIPKKVVIFKAKGTVGVE
jgi:rRNA-processing protein FCF1